MNEAGSSSTSEPTQPAALPTARLREVDRARWLWLIPLAALLLAAWIGWTAWSQRGVRVRVLLEQGHGLRVGDDVRFRGIAVGRIESIGLADDLQGVVITAVLDPASALLARAGARFWVVRPQVGFSGVAGLDTIVGPRYLTLLPGDGRAQRFFVGLEAPPVVEQIEPGDLEIVLESARRESVRAGAPLLYRQVPVGTVLSVGLTSDSSRVEARVHVQKAYAQLIRPQSRFWTVGKLEAQVGLRGMSLQVDSLEALVAGGVAVATPPGAGEPVRNGRRFTLYPQPRDEWLAWSPLIPIGSELLPAGARLPAPLRAVLSWSRTRALVWKADEARRGWVLQTADGLLGPIDLFRPPEGAEAGSVALEIGGERMPTGAAPRAMGNGLGLLAVEVSPAVWPAELTRQASEPEDCVVVGDPAASPLPLSAARLSAAGSAGWRVDPAVALEPSLHGAAVLGRSDGMLVGLLLVQGDGARVALVEP